jgi:hypothetical protein
VIQQADREMQRLADLCERVSDESGRFLDHWSELSADELDESRSSIGGLTPKRTTLVQDLETNL